MDIDETVIVDQELPDSWICPRCGKKQRFDKIDHENFIEYMQLIRHCDRCSYLHHWTLKLTDDFKRKVINMLLEG